MKKSKKVAKILSLFCIVAFIFSILMGMTFTRGNNLVAHADPQHDHTGWTAWNTANALPTSAGNYYLDTDVVLSGQWSVPNATVNLCLNGHGITQTANARVILINGGTLNLYDCGDTVHYFDVNDNGKAINVNEEAGENRKSFTGGFITGGVATSSPSSPGSYYWNSGGGVLVQTGTYNMYGGTILGNNCGGNFGGGAEVINGTMTLNDSTIMYNVGCGVNLRSEGGAIGRTNALAKITINNSEISYNNGHGVGTDYCYGYAQMFASNSTFSNNKSCGVSVGGAASTDYNTAIISDCTFEDNGSWGLAINKDTTFLGDITVRRNGYGVSVRGAINFTPGKYTITDNVRTNNNELVNTGFYVRNGYKISLSGDITGSVIEVSMEQPGVFTDDNMEDYLEFFSSSDSKYVVKVQEDTKSLFLYEHIHNFEYVADGATITATCMAEDCPIAEGLSLNVLAPVGDLIENGTPYQCSLAPGFNTTAFPNVSNSDIEYYVNGDEQVTSCINPGTYLGKITVCDVTASVEFTIRPEHEHSYSSTWSSDEDTHWHACTVENCPEPKKDETAHTYGETSVSRYTCTVCSKENAELKAQAEARDREAQAEKDAQDNKPQNLEGLFGDKLNTVALPNKYSWVNPNTLLDNLGENTFNAKYNDGTYEFNLQINVLVKPRVIVDTDSGVSVKISNSEESLDPNVTIEIEVKTTVMAQEVESDFEVIKAKLEKDETITKVYDVKLIRTVDGVSTEIQPSDIKPGTVITITMTIPEEIANQEFKILHIHSNNDIEFITNFKKNGTEISFDTDRLSEFAYIVKLPAPAKVRHGFCVGVILMILSILLYLFVALFAILRFGFFKELVTKVKLDKLYDKVTLLEYIAMYASGAMFLFSLISLVLHQCGFTIVFFILNFLVCAGAVFLFLVDQQIIKLSFKRKPKEE